MKSCKDNIWNMITEHIANLTSDLESHEDDKRWTVPNEEDQDLVYFQRPEPLTEPLPEGTTIDQVIVNFLPLWIIIDSKLKKEIEKLPPAKAYQLLKEIMERDHPDVLSNP